MQAGLPLRGIDRWGNGAYKAPRTRGKKTYLHTGVDYACYPGTQIIQTAPGKVTYIGYPYSPSDPVKGHLRYVQVTERNKFRCRYFYVSALVTMHQEVYAGTVLGVTQKLDGIYPGITNHVHFEIYVGPGKTKHLDPEKYMNGDYFSGIVT